MSHQVDDTCNIIDSLYTEEHDEIDSLYVGEHESNTNIGQIQDNIIDFVVGIQRYSRKSIGLYSSCNILRIGDREIQMYYSTRHSKYFELTLRDSVCGMCHVMYERPLKQFFAFGSICPKCTRNILTCFGIGHMTNFLDLKKSMRNQWN